MLYNSYGYVFVEFDIDKTVSLIRDVGRWCMCTPGRLKGIVKYHCLVRCLVPVSIAPEDQTLTDGLSSQDNYGRSTVDPRLDVHSGQILVNSLRTVCLRSILAPELLQQIIVTSVK